MPTTPNLNMVLPIPGTTCALGVVGPGLSWLELLNAALSRLDGHTHAPGNGAAVPAAGVSINGDLPFGAHNATGLRSARFSPISLGALGASDLGALVVSGADLYYVDTGGNQVRLTSGGALAGTPGSIGGLTSPAAVSYTAGSKLFDFTSQSGIRAYLNIGPISVYDPQAGGKYAQIKAPAGLAANYAITLPSALPGAQSFLTLDAAGNLAVGVAYANGIARGNLASVGQQVSPSCGSFQTSSTTFIDVTNLTVSVTTTGRPIVLAIISDDTGNGAAFRVTDAAGTAQLQLTILRGATEVARHIVEAPASAIYTDVPGSLVHIDAPVAGTYTYKVQAKVALGTTAGGPTGCKLIAYEL